MGKKRFVFMIVSFVFIIFLSINIISQNMQGVKNKVGQRGKMSGTVHVSGFISVNTEKNDINANITLKNLNSRGVPLRGVRIVFNEVPLHEGSPGNYTGTSRANYIKRGGPQGVMRRKSNLNMSIFMRGSSPIELSGNLSSGMRIRIEPLYRKGVNIGDPINIFWDSNKKNRNRTILTIFNTKGEVIFENDKLRGNSHRFQIPRARRPRGGVLTFQILQLEQRLVISGNVSRDSYVDIYSEASVSYNTYR